MSNLKDLQDSSFLSDLFLHHLSTSLLLGLRLIVVYGFQIRGLFIHQCGVGWVTGVPLLLRPDSGKQANPFSFWSCCLWYFLQAARSAFLLYMAQAVPSETPALCWYGNRLQILHQEDAATLRFNNLWVLIQDIWRTFFNASLTSPDLQDQPIFLLQSCQVISFPCVPLWSALSRASYTSMERYGQCLAILDEYFSKDKQVLAIPGTLSCWKA